MNLLVTGLNLPFESPPQSITQLSSALAAFDRGCAMVKISGFGEVPVLYCKRLLIILASVTLIQEPLKPLRFISISIHRNITESQDDPRYSRVLSHLYRHIYD